MKISKWLSQNRVLFVIMLGALFLRVYKLDVIPPSLNPDEASLGYNAYSILKTGRDEYGKFLPVVFKSFGDYKPGLYVYLTVPFILFLGLTEFAVRLPAALAGVTGVWFLYKIVLELFSDKRHALFASLFLALSPWHIIFSRGAWEVNVSLTLTLAGIYFFVLAFRRGSYLLLSSLCFSLTLVTYQGAKLSTLIVLVILSSLYIKKILRVNTKLTLVSIALGFIVTLPILLGIFRGQAGRLSVFSIFSNRRPTESLEAFLAQGGERVGDLGYYIFHSENLNFVRGIMGRMFNHYSARFLFFEGDWQNAKHSSPYHGVLTLADSIFLAVGIFVLTRAKQNRGTWLVWLWFLLAPLPSVLSRDDVHAVRSYHMVVPLSIILSFGALRLYEALGRRSVFVGLIYLLSYLYFLDSYYVHMPVHNSQSWDYGYKQIVETVTPIQDEFETVRVQQSYSQPYIYFLFYQRYDPARYQEKDRWIQGDIVGDVGKVEHVDNLYFGPIDWSVNRGDTETLFVADTIRIPPEDSSDPEEFDLVREIRYLNGKTAFRIISVKERE